MIHHGDCLDVMAGMDPESIDAIVTDPPYGLEFMGKEWDKFQLIDDRAATRDESASRPFLASQVRWSSKSTGVKGAVEVRGRSLAAQQFHARWAEAAYRVAKPSAYLLAFGGTRTVHRMTVALEDAGWIIRDMLVWGYASGFPKSKASLKPAWEPIVMARRPGPLRMLAIDECRIGPPPESRPNTPPTFMRPERNDGRDVDRLVEYQQEWQPRETDPTLGRWPANIVLSDPIFDGGIEGVVGGGETSSGALRPYTERHESATSYQMAREKTYTSEQDTGTYSRFFLIPKAARSDREPVLGGHGLSGERGYGGGKGVKTRECLECGDRTQSDTRPFQPACQHGNWEWRDALPIARANVHPTVKPVDLMRHLVRLVTPSGGTVLDPFLGSGTTGLAAEMEGFAWIGIEREAEYVAIAEARLNGTQRGLGLDIV